MSEARPTDRRRAHERSGRSAENLAALFLRLKFYRILDRRFKTPVGEIDLVARRGKTIAFVEVKRRPSAALGLEAISPIAQQRLIRAAEAWLARHPEAMDCTLRFDALVIVPRRLPLHLEGAFDASRR